MGGRGGAGRCGHEPANIVYGHLTLSAYLRARTLGRRARSAERRGGLVRILIVDDEPGMHDSYRRCFAPVEDTSADALNDMAAELFGDAAPTTPGDDVVQFDAVQCIQGLDAVAEVEAAIAQGAPFAVAFIHVRKPPRLDRKETAARIRALDPNINLVIVTGFSDFSPIEISKAAGPADKIFYIAKPFEIAEVVQTPTALGHRCQVDRDLAAALAKHHEQT